MTASAGAAPANDAVKLGCYYFPGWYSADRWAPILEHGGRDPILGCYRDELPAVQDWHIRQATQHGISFWVFDWYYDHRSGIVADDNAALDKGFLKASLRDKMQFSLMWCNEEAGSPSYTEAEMLRLVQTIGARYLCQSNYLRAPDGRSILVISRPDRLITRFSSDGTKVILKKMSEAARPWGGLFFVVIQHPTASNLRNMRLAGFDACTLYSYAEHGMKSGQHEAPYDTILPVIEPVWRQAAESQELPIIPCVSPGWDSRPWYGQQGLARTGSSPEKFGAMCSTLKPFVDPTLGLILVGTWNEFGEGSYVEPTRQRGCAMLDAMQRAFFLPAESYTILRPAEQELATLDFADIPTHLEAEVARQGGNLVINPGFERDWGWIYYDGSPAAYSSNVVHSGRRALFLKKANGGVKTQALAPGVAWPDSASNRIEVKPERKYLVSVWVYGKARISAALFGKDHQWLRRYQPVAEGGRAGEWQKVQAVISVSGPEPSTFDLEAIPLDEEVFLDDVGVWVQ